MYKTLLIFILIPLFCVGEAHASFTQSYGLSDLSWSAHPLRPPLAMIYHTFWNWNLTIIRTYTIFKTAIYVNGHGMYQRAVGDICTTNLIKN